MAHYVQTADLENIMLGIEHEEWGKTQNSNIEMGDTVELRTKLKEEGHIATVIVTTDPEKRLDPDFGWRDRNYPWRYKFKVINMASFADRENINTELVRMMNDDGIKSQSAYNGHIDIGKENYKALQKLINRNN